MEKTIHTIGRKMGKFMRRGSFDLPVNINDPLTKNHISKPSDFRTIFSVGFKDGKFVGLPESWRLRLCHGQIRYSCDNDRDDNDGGGGNADEDEEDEEGEDDEYEENDEDEDDKDAIRNRYCHSLDPGFH